MCVPIGAKVSYNYLLGLCISNIKTKYNIVEDFVRYSKRVNPMTVLLQFLIIKTTKKRTMHLPIWRVSTPFRKLGRGANVALNRGSD
jgi:hypothetical protein